MPTTASRELVVLANPAPQHNYRVELNCPEFTCLCPMTGQPDFASIDITYEPAKHIIELKSLKLYLWSFRDEGHYHEAVVNTILADLVEALAPTYLGVHGYFNVRGGIGTAVHAEYNPTNTATASQ